MRITSSPIKQLLRDQIAVRRNSLSLAAAALAIVILLFIAFAPGQAASGSQLPDSLSEPGTSNTLPTGSATGLINSATSAGNDQPSGSSGSNAPQTAGSFIKNLASTDAGATIAVAITPATPNQSDDTINETPPVSEPEPTPAPTPEPTPPATQPQPQPEPQPQNNISISADGCTINVQGQPGYFVSFTAEAPDLTRGAGSDNYVIPASGVLTVANGAPLAWIVNAYLKDEAGNTVAQANAVVTALVCLL